MAAKLSQEEIVTLKVLRDKGQSFREIAATLGICEGTARYHCKRAGQTDGRKAKPRKAAVLADVIDTWVLLHQDGQGHAQQTQAEKGKPDLVRPVNVLALFDWLCSEHGYRGSYRSVLRFVRDRYPAPRLRPFRRVETPPGAQAQVDWGEGQGVDIGSGPQKLYGFVMVLSHSRKQAVIWCPRTDQLSWHSAHNQAFRRLGGIAASVRIDNLKTGIVAGAGPWGQINSAYRVYANCVGFHIDACLPRCPEHKGKVENKVGFIKGRLKLAGRFDGLAGLQRATDEQLLQSDLKRVCPATGLSVQQSWQDEQRRLRPLPGLPEPFDLSATRTVQRDGTISFEGRVYSVPFVLCGLQVQVHGCACVVQVWHQGVLVAEHPRHTTQRLLLNPEHYEGPGNERVMPPVPLGKMGRKLQEIAQMPVEQRPLDLYAALAEVAR